MDIRLEQVSLDKEVSSTPLATVYKGTYCDQDVAVRKPKISGPEVLQRFETEVAVLNSVSHPNVVPIVASSSSPPNYAILSPWYHNGAVHDMIHNVSDTHGNSDTDGKPRMTNPTVAQRFQFVKDLASALAYLHSEGIVHRDVKSSNLLVDDSGTAVLADFEMADTEKSLEARATQLMERGRATGGYQSRKGGLKTAAHRTVGSLVTMAPEIINNTGIGTKGHIFTWKADVYSFGITANEIMDMKIPYSDRFTSDVNLHTILDMNYSESTLANAITSEDLRPSVSSALPPSFQSLVQSCWAKDRETRPTMAQVLERLSSIEQEMMAMDSNARADVEDVDMMDEGVMKQNGFLAVSKKEEEERAKRLGAHDQQLLDRIKTVADANGSATAPKNRWLVNLLSECGAKVVTPCRAHHYSTAGRRYEQEDTSVVELDLFPSSDWRVTFIGVYDGHGGAEASDMAARSLHKYLQADCDSATVEEALTSAFLKTHEVFCEMFPQSKAGCTALAAVIVGNRVIIANAGDCRAILLRRPDVAEAVGKPLCVQLSRDHHAGVESERERVLALGGRVEKKDTWRVNGILEVTRALGDMHHQPFVTALPELSRHTIDTEGDGDYCFIVGTDGVFDVLSNESIRQMISETVKVPDMAARRIVGASFDAGSKDNITAAIAFFTHDEGVERVYGSDITSR